LLLEAPTTNMILLLKIQSFSISPTNTLSKNLGSIAICLCENSVFICFSNVLTSIFSLAKSSSFSFSRSFKMP